MAEIHKELFRSGVTLKHGWWEYKEIQPDGLQYIQSDIAQVSRYLVMHQHDKITRGFSLTGLDKASLSALESLVKLATPTCIWRLLGPATMPLDFVVPDNLKTGVTKPNYYDPDTNPTCDMAQH